MCIRIPLNANDLSSSHIEEKSDTRTNHQILHRYYKHEYEMQKSEQFKAQQAYKKGHTDTKAHSGKKHIH